MAVPSDILFYALLGAPVPPINDDEGKDWRCFVNFLPDDKTVKTRAVCLTDTPPFPDGRLMGTGEVIEHPGVQILVRAEDYGNCYRKLHEIATWLSTVKMLPVVIPNDGTYTLVSITRTSSFGNMGYDDVRRYHMSLNVTLTVDAGVTSP